MENRHIPTSLRLMPRALRWEEPVNTWTEVFSNCRFRRRLSLKLPSTTMCAKPLEYKVAQWQSRAKITEVQCCNRDVTGREQAISPTLVNECYGDFSPTSDGSMDRCANLPQQRARCSTRF